MKRSRDGQSNIKERQITPSSEEHDSRAMPPPPPSRNKTGISSKFQKLEMCYYLQPLSEDPKEWEAVFCTITEVYADKTYQVFAGNEREARENVTEDQLIAFPPKPLENVTEDELRPFPPKEMKPEPVKKYKNGTFVWYQKNTTDVPILCNVLRSYNPLGGIFCYTLTSPCRATLIYNALEDTLSLEKK